MKKILAIFLICLLALAGPAFAKADYASENVSILGPNMGSIGMTPVTEIIKVRYGHRENSLADLSSGDVVVWSTISADGYTISACEVDHAVSYAGVLVTDLAATDTSTKKAFGRNVGYMAIRGWCLAKIDITETTNYFRIVPNGGPGLVGSFGTVDNVNAVALQQATQSPDVGMVFVEPAADGLGPVWLK